MQHQVIFELGYQAMHTKSYLSLLPKPIVQCIIYFVFKLPKKYELHDGKECIFSLNSFGLHEFVDKILSTVPLSDKPDKLDLFSYHILKIFVAEENDEIFKKTKCRILRKETRLMFNDGKYFGSLWMNAFNTSFRCDIDVFITAINLNDRYCIICKNDYYNRNI